MACLRLQALALLSPVLVDSIDGLGQDGQARRTAVRCFGIRFDRDGLGIAVEELLTRLGDIDLVSEGVLRGLAPMLRL